MILPCRSIHEIYMRSSLTPDDLLARLGEHDTLSIKEPYLHVDKKIESIFIHPKFDKETMLTKGYDIALLRLAEPGDFALNIVPICLPQDNDTLVGEIGWAKGFGRMYDGK